MLPAPVSASASVHSLHMLGGRMHRKTLAVWAGAIIALGSAGTTARAQVMTLPTGSGTGGLSADDVRVLQFALRDAGCYQGPRNGVMNAATRNAIRCAQEKTGQSGEGLARELGLFEVDDASSVREAGGDVAPGAPSGNQPSVVRP